MPTTAELNEKFQAALQLMLAYSIVIGESRETCSAGRSTEEVRRIWLLGDKANALDRDRSGTDNFRMPLGVMLLAATAQTRAYLMKNEKLVAIAAEMGLMDLGQQAKPQLEPKTLAALSGLIAWKWADLSEERVDAVAKAIHEEYGLEFEVLC